MKTMNRSRRLLAILQVGAAAWGLAAPQPGLAYDHPLGGDAVRDAYFLGQDLGRASTFLKPYTQLLPVPSTGPDVAQVELSTPYAQVVEVSMQHTVGYSAQQAAEDHKKRGDSILVRVEVLFTPTYTGDDDYWRGVSVGLIQGKQHMGAASVDGQPIYQSGAPGNGSWVIGANVFVTFPVAGVKSDTVQVEVVPPGGPAVHATFDLSDLR
jgi:hypothetical protein